MRHPLVVTAAVCVMHCTPGAQDDSTASAMAPEAPICIQPTPDAAPSAVAPGPAARCPPDPGRDQDVPVLDVAFPDACGAVVHAWLVTSQQDQERGLMYRTSMPQDEGMLFDLQVTGNHEFWMENTCIPLDMMFASADGTIVGIVENAAPLETTPLGVGCPSRYVLEVNAGWTRVHGVRARQVMTVPAKL
jgi:uncharacterized membrane protein (UPF0127 family)